ncbi:mitochondrial antiviral-signaling protein isoform X2 [Pogoniulus pusillus]|uniref:mitochondrial antiviral-signaling protein isoform X2 n=1 Tax=Pogoniulus pusillus TaxID=488313 RepID=UPI0030B938C4
MGFAEDKVYDYILRNLKNFRNIRVASLADSLSCLTDADRDELHTREETRGSQATVYRFYQYLKCRQGWVPDLIDALRHNNAEHLANELQHLYDSLQVSPPGAPAPAAAPSPPAATGVCPNTSIRAQTPSPRPVPAPSVPLAKQLHQDQPADSPPPSLPSSAVADRDARIPVQESLSESLPERESPQTLPSRSTVCDGTNNGKSGEGHLLKPTGAAQEAARPLGAASVDVPSAVAAEQGQSWLSRPQHPVCVDNGCFGNAKHLQRGAPGLGLRAGLPTRQQGTACHPEPRSNEPQEDSYISTESPLRLEGAAHSGGLQPPDSTPENQAAPSSEPLESLVDVRSPLLIQQQVDGEQKQNRMLQKDGRDRDTRMETASPAAALVPIDTSPSHTTPLNCAQEDKQTVEKMASSTLSVPAKEKVFMDSVPAVAESSEVPSERMAPRDCSGTSIWEPGSDVEGDELSKPDVLLSISSFSLSSDPLFLSTDSSKSGEALSRVNLRCPAPAAHVDPRGEEAAGASNNSCPPPSRDSTSLGIHEDHYPSMQFKEGNNIQDGADPLGNPPVLDTSSNAVSSSPEARVSLGDSSRSSMPYILPAVGIALLSALLVYKRLQK